MIKYLPLLLILLTPNLYANTHDPDRCRQDIQEIRDKSLTELTLIDQYFNTVYWQRFHFFETVYSPLFEAKIRMNDTFSPALRAEGAVLYGRYQHEADVYHSLYRQESKRLWRSFAKLTHLVKSAAACCAAASFQACHDEWQSLSKNQLRTLKKALSRQDALLRTLAHRVTLSLLENPSEHYPFPDRYAQEWQERQLNIVPVYLSSARAIRELFDIKNPEICCAQCTAAKAGVEEDAVLRELRPSERPSEGIKGPVIHKSSLLNAFKDLDERSGS